MSPRANHSSQVINGLKEKIREAVGEEADRELLAKNFEELNANPIAARIFTHMAQTSTAIQVAWSHP